MAKRRTDRSEPGADQRPGDVPGAARREAPRKSSSDTESRHTVAVHGPSEPASATSGRERLRRALNLTTEVDVDRLCEEAADAKRPVAGVAVEQLELPFGPTPRGARLLNPSRKTKAPVEVKLDLRAIGKRIKRSRVRHRWQQDDLARVIGVTTNMVWAFERGDELPNLKMLVRIAKAVRRKVDWILFGGRDYWWRRRSPDRD